MVVYEGGAALVMTTCQQALGIPYGDCFTVKTFQTVSQAPRADGQGTDPNSCVYTVRARRRSCMVLLYFSCCMMSVVR